MSDKAQRGSKWGYRKLPNDERTRLQFENMCKIQCTKEEIAGVFNVGARTLDRWIKENYGATFDKVYKSYSASGKMSLRRHQFKQSEKNAVMAIWLGKQYLNQSDQQQVRIVGDDQPDDLTKAIQSSIKTLKKKQKVKDTVEVDDDFFDFNQEDDD